MNVSDAERLSLSLENSGFKKIEDRDKADVFILVTCGVRQGAEDRVIGIVPKFKKKHPKTTVVLSGCLSQRKDVQEKLKKYVDIWLPAPKIPELAKMLEANSNTGSLEFLNSSDYLKLEPKYSSSISAFVPIGNGCDNFCTYCVVPHARGRESYRDAQEIIQEVKNLVAKNYKEITLIAQNVNSYKSDNLNFPKLLKQCAQIEGNFWLRFSTSHPKDMSDELIDVIQECPKICRHIHLPVQSGNDQILKEMNRKYTAQDYRNLVKKIRSKLPEYSITTDVIVGFPKETQAQFQDTVKLFEEIKFDMAYISRYSPRPNTAAFHLEDNISPTEKRDREVSLNKVLEQTNLENSSHYLNQILEVLIDGEDKKGNLLGRTKLNKKIKIINNKKNISGNFALIKINKIQPFGMEGDICEYQ